MKKNFLKSAFIVLTIFVLFFTSCKNPTDDNTTPVTPTVAVTGVSLNRTAFTLKLNGEETLVATVEPSDATDKGVTWKSSDSTVADVANGKITAKSDGTATITVTTTDGSKTATCTVTVKTATDISEISKYKSLPKNTDGTAGTAGTYITFGVWPQTVKKSDITVDEIEANKMVMGMFTYYMGSDGEWYCEALENAYGSGNEYTYSDGTTKVAQKYANSYKWFKVEPIKWRVLTDNYSGKKLIFCESGIYAGVPYYDNISTRTIGGNTVYPNNYEHSRIRAWLNGLSFQLGNATNSDHNGKGFLQTAFTAEEQSAIAMTTVDNSVESTNPSSGPGFNNGFNDYACNNTTDKIFLLSYTEVTNSSAYGFADNNTRIRKQTDFALANYAWKNSNAAYGGVFFLRSPNYCDSSNALGVSAVGDAYSDGSSDVLHTDGVVAPALSITP